VRIEFRPLVDADLPLLHEWLNDPAIVRWWEGDDVSWDGVVADYGSGRDDRTTEHWLALADGRELGWIQCYATADEPDEYEEAWALGLDRSAAGIDYLVGRAEDRGRGLGPAMIRAFIRDIVFGRHPHWTQACAAPASSNVASWRALEKVGFRFLGEVPDPEGRGRLMVIDRTG
jgi:aminoglycoside 6'-N-acetyltransferase